MKIKKNIKKIIDAIINEFTSEELKFLEINKNGKITTFKEMMTAEYGKMWFKQKYLGNAFYDTTLLTITKIQNELKNKNTLTPKEIDSYIKKFNCFFTNKKPKNKWTDIVIEIMKYLIPTTITAIIGALSAYLQQPSI